MIVVSTAYDPPPAARLKCLLSVPRGARHVYVDAAKQDPSKAHFENLIDALGEAGDNEIIACLDGDDWLTEGALDHVQRAHDAGALVTYGSYVCADGRPGHGRRMTSEELENPRLHPWVASHLKTFRADLFREIDLADLKDPNGDWLVHARDMALMFPLLELARPFVVHIPEILYVYNYANSFEHQASMADRLREREAVRYVRGLPRYGSLFE